MAAASAGVDKPAAARAATQRVVKANGLSYQEAKSLCPKKAGETSTAWKARLAALVKQSNQ